MLATSVTGDVLTPFAMSREKERIYTKIFHKASEICNMNHYWLIGNGLARNSISRYFGIACNHFSEIRNQILTHETTAEQNAFIKRPAFTFN